jgi:hypothetical protein
MGRSGTIQRRKRASGIVETRVSGVVSLAVALEAITQIDLLIEKGRWYELVLHDELALLDIDYASGDELATRGRAFLDSLSEGAVAFVAEEDAAYGRCRQLQMRLDSSRIEIEVFRDGELARAWLDEKQQTSAAPQPQLDLTIDIAPLRGSAQQSEQLVKSWRVLRGEFEPRDEVERFAELAALVEAPRDRGQVS